MSGKIKPRRNEFVCEPTIPIIQGNAAPPAPAAAKKRALSQVEFFPKICAIQVT